MTARIGPVTVYVTFAHSHDPVCIFPSHRIRSHYPPFSGRSQENRITVVIVHDLAQRQPPRAAQRPEIGAKTTGV